MPRELLVVVRLAFVVGSMEQVQGCSWAVALHSVEEPVWVALAAMVGGLSVFGLIGPCLCTNHAYVSTAG